MRNLHRHNSSRSLGRTSLIAISVFAVLIVAVNIASGGFVRSLVQDGVSVIWDATASAGDAIASSGVLSSGRSLAEENIALRAQIASLQSLKVENKVLSEENDSLRLLNQTVEQYEVELSAEVISYVDASPYGTFVIGAGSAKGVIAGSLVLANGSVLVGTIESVGTHTSQVRSVFAPNRVIEGRVGDTTSVEITGRGGGNGTMMVPRDTEVSEGDLVYYAAGSSVVGEVGAIDASSADAEKTLFVRTPLNLYGVRFVSVVSSI